MTEPVIYVSLKEASQHLGCRPSELGKPVYKKPWRHGKTRTAYISHERYQAVCEKRGIEPARLLCLYWKDGRTYAVTDC